MAKLGKRLTQAYSFVDRDKIYQLNEAVDILIQASKTKFDETVDIAVRLGLDPRKAEENIRGTVSLPHGTGKKVRVLALCKLEKQEEGLNKLMWHMPMELEHIKTLNAEDLAQFLTNET